MSSKKNQLVMVFIYNFHYPPNACNSNSKYVKKKENENEEEKKHTNNNDILFSTK